MKEVSEEIVTVSLEEIPGIFNVRRRALEELNRKLNQRLQIITTLNEEEKSLYESLNYAKKVQEALGSFFYGATIENLNLIEESIKSIEGTLQEKAIKFSKNIESKEFSDDNLSQFYSDLSEFLGQQVSSLSKILEFQEKVFKESTKEIYDKFNALNRLVSTLLKRVEASEDKAEFVDILRAEFTKVKQLIDNIPDDVAKLAETNKLIKGLYVSARDELSSSREKIKQIAIENGLLTENEVSVLETLYEAGIKEADLSKVIQILMQKLGIEKEDIQRLLFELSERGFVVMKLIAE